MKIPDRDWQVHVYDADVDESAYELITELATTYVQLAADDTIQVVSASASDITQTVSIVTIDDEGRRVENSIHVDTTAGTTAVNLGGGTHRYYEGSSLDIPGEGVITIRRTTNTTFIDSIAVGQLKSGAVQHFNGEKYTRLKRWWASNLAGTDDVELQLRWYPNDASCRVVTTGFEIVDRIQLATAQMDSPIHELDPTKVYPPGGWFAVVGKGASADEKVSVTLTGSDSNS